MTDHDNKLAKRKAKARRRPVGLITQSTALPELDPQPLPPEEFFRQTLSPEAEERFLQKAFGKWPLPASLPDETLDPPPTAVEMAMAEQLVMILTGAEEWLHYPFHLTIEGSDGLGRQWMVPARDAEDVMLLEYSAPWGGPVEPLTALVEVREYDPATGSSKDGGGVFCGRIEIVLQPIN